MDLNPQARFFLQQIENDFAFEQGILFQQALKQLNLDFSLASIKRIDAFFSHWRARQQQPFDSQQFTRQAANINLALLLAYYLGEVIARQLGTTIHWYSHEAAREVLPADMDWPPTLSYSLVGMLAGNICLPLGVVGEWLFEKKPPVSFSSYVTDRIQRIQKDQSVTTQDWVNRFLFQFEEQAPFAGGLAYQDMLHRAELDFSVSSLERLDVLITLLRQTKKFNHAGVFRHTDKSNFVLLIAFYMIEVALRHTQSFGEWLGFDELNQQLGGTLVFDFETSHACRINQQIYLPIRVVMQNLGYRPDPAAVSIVPITSIPPLAPMTSIPPSCGEYVHDLIAQLGSSVD